MINRIQETGRVSAHLRAVEKTMKQLLVVAAFGSTQNRWLWPSDLHRLVADLPDKALTATSHWLDMDKPEELSSILDEFLKEVR